MEMQRNNDLLQVTLNGQKRYVRPWAVPLVVVLALPGLAVLLVVFALLILAGLLGFPALLVGWLLGEDA